MKLEVMEIRGPDAAKGCGKTDKMQNTRTTVLQTLKPRRTTRTVLPSCKRQRGKLEKSLRNYYLNLVIIFIIIILLITIIIIIIPSSFYHFPKAAVVALS